MSSYTLTLTPVRISEIPSEETALAAGRAILDSTNSWKKGKAFHKGVVQTYSRSKGPGDSANWHCRVSTHTTSEATFDEMWSRLGVDKAENEMQFIPDIDAIREVKRISPTQSVWSMHYNLQSPVSARYFTVLQVVNLDNASPRTGLIVSIPIDTTHGDDQEYAKLEHKGVKGRYVSVERIMEMPDGKIEWRMATSSRPEGNIPQTLAEMTMPSQISQDVPHFMHWLQGLREKEGK